MIHAELLGKKDATGWISTTVGNAAFALDKAWTSARVHGQAQAFLHQQEQMVASARFPDYLRQPRGMISGKNQPSFVDAVTQTIKRLTFLEQFSARQPTEVVGQICGGSMSYGRFYTIRGEPDPSDIDLIMVVDPVFFSKDHAQKAMISPEKGFRPQEAELFAQRCKKFKELYGQGKADMLSQRFAIDDYEMSLKVIPFPEFVWEFTTVPRALIMGREDKVVAILDYKNPPMQDTYSPRKNFLGEAIVFNGRQEVVEGGDAIAQVPAAVFKNGLLYTGDHHNHIIPKFEVYTDTEGKLAGVVNEFKSLLRSEFDTEVAGHAYWGKADVLNVLDRLPLLSPQVVEQAHKELIE